MTKRLLWLALLLGGCGSVWPQVQQRASVDLACPAARIGGRWLDDRTAVAEGCQRRAVYVSNCDGPSCTWKLDSPIQTIDLTRSSTP